MKRMLGFVAVLLALFNIGIVINIVFTVTRQEWTQLIISLGWFVVFNGLGLWLLRELRGS